MAASICLLYSIINFTIKVLNITINDKGKDGNDGDPDQRACYPSAMLTKV